VGALPYLPGELNSGSVARATVSRSGNRMVSGVNSMVGGPSGQDSPLLRLPVMAMPSASAQVLCSAEQPFCFDESDRPTVAAGMVLRGALGTALARYSCSPSGFAGSDCERRRGCRLDEPCRYALWYKPGLTSGQDDVAPALRIDHRALTARVIERRFVLPVAAWGEKAVSGFAGLIGALGDTGALGLDATTPDGLHPQTTRFALEDARIGTAVPIADLVTSAAESWKGCHTALVTFETLLQPPGSRPAALHAPLEPMALFEAMVKRVATTEAALRIGAGSRVDLAAVAQVFGELRATAPLRTESATTLPVAVAQRSTRSGQSIVRGGLIGSMVISGNLEAWLPAFVLAELCGLGRHTAYGLGFARISPIAATRTVQISQMAGAVPVPGPAIALSSMQNSAERISEDLMPSKELAPQVTQEQLAACDRVMARIATARAQGFAVWALGVAAAVVEELYGGDIEKAFSARTRPGDGLSVLLAERGAALAEFDLGKDAIRNYIRALKVSQSLPEEVRSKLDVTKLQRLAVVKEPAVQQALASEAASRGWSRTELDKHLPLGRTKPGKKPTSLKRLHLTAKSTLEGARKLRRYEAGLAELPQEQQRSLRNMAIELQAIALEILQKLPASED
jgi:hypothetical protein